MKSTKKQLKKVQIVDTKIKTVMSTKIYNQIQYLCREIPKVEWSGVLFYDIEGSIKNISEMVINLREILPLDKGSSAHTEFTFDSSYADYIMENSHLEDCKTGLVHSHNTMDVFFSAEDWSELEDNTPNHNFYLSLIVNNYMDFCAKLCLIAEANEVKSYNYLSKDENGNSYIHSVENLTSNSNKLVSYDCEISVPRYQIVTEDYFNRQVNKVIEEAKVRDSKKNIVYKENSLKKETKFNYINWDNMSFSGKHVEEEELDIENFVLYLFNSGKDADIFIDLEEVVKQYEDHNITIKSLSDFICINYVKYYEKYFGNTLAIFQDTKEVISILEDEYVYSNNKYFKNIVKLVYNFLEEKYEN